MQWLERRRSPGMEPSDDFIVRDRRFCHGFESTGFATAWANDIDPYACSVYRLSFPKNRLIEKDVRELSVRKDRLEPVDVLHAGFPCQSFSQAGSRKGFDDERGKLFYEIIRIVKEFKQDKPRVIVLENAPYLKYGAGGLWFLEVSTQLQKAGYWFRESNAQELDLFELTDIPQQRTRLFMVAWSIDHFRASLLREVLPHSHGRVGQLVPAWEASSSHAWPERQHDYRYGCARSTRSRTQQSDAGARRYPVFRASSTHAGEI